MQKLSAGVLALCVGLGSTAYAAPPATSTRVVTKGASIGGYASVVADGCVEGQISYWGYEDTSKDTAGNPVVTKTGYAYFYAVDDCKKLSYSLAEDETGVRPPTVSIGENTYTLTFSLNIVVARTNVPDGTDGTLREGTLTATMTFTQAGAFENTRETIITIKDGLRTKYRSKGETRDADVKVTNADLDGKKWKFQTNNGSGGSFGKTKSATVETTRN